MNGIQKTVYGYKKSGSSQFIIVAPHASGDDLRSSSVAKKLTFKLNAFLVVNKKFFKPTNSRAKINPENVEDFNDLCWSEKNKKYLWKRKNPAMKIFYQDISDFCEEAKKNTKDKPVAIYIHSFSSEKIGIDIGVGAQEIKRGGKIFGSGFHWLAARNSGEISLKIGTTKKIYRDLAKNLKKDYNLAVTIGKTFPGWSRQTAIQFHRHEPRDEYALQFEINKILRSTKENINYTVKILAEILQEYFI